MNAKSERVASIDELHVMLQNLLAERCNLRFHVESRQAPIYVLSLDKQQVKMVRHDPKTPDETGVDLDGEGLGVTITGKAAPVSYFAWRLSQVLDRPVFDRTHIEGNYDFALSFFREPPISGIVGAPSPASDALSPNVFEAVRDQLGLRLERDKGPVDLMVIDTAERPTEN